MTGMWNVPGTGRTAPVKITNVSRQEVGPSKFGQVLRSVSDRGRDLDPVFNRASQAYGVPQELLRAIGFHESGFEADAVSSAGAMGIMQLMPATAQTMGVADPYDAEQNIMGGAKLLSQLLEQYDGDLKLTLAAYGAGSGAVKKYGGIPPYNETQNFVADIMSAVDVDSLNSGMDSAYPSFADQVRSFDGFTATDYQKMLMYLLTPSEQDSSDTPFPLFYLG